jgi:hypothetical protein
MRRVLPKKTLGDAMPSAATPVVVVPVTATPPSTVDRPMTPKQLASFLQVSPASIRRRLDEIPHMKVGNRVRFMPSDVLVYFRGKYQRKP